MVILSKKKWEAMIKLQTHNEKMLTELTNLLMENIASVKALSVQATAHESKISKLNSIAGVAAIQDGSKNTQRTPHEEWLYGQEEEKKS